jgi:hypothetical protein
MGGPAVAVRKAQVERENPLTRPSGRVHAVVRLGSGRPSCTTVPRWIERLKLYKTVVAYTPFGPLFGRFFRRHATRARLSELTEGSVAASVRISVLVQSWLPRPRPRRKRHAACVALLGASHSVRCRERSRGSRSSKASASQSSKLKAQSFSLSKLQPLSGAGRFMSQRQPGTYANLRAAKLSGDVATIARIAVSEGWNSVTACKRPLHCTAMSRPMATCSRHGLCPALCPYCGRSRCSSKRKILL